MVKVRHVWFINGVLYDETVETSPTCYFLLQIVVSTILSKMRHDGWAVIIQRRQPKTIKALELNCTDPIIKS